MMNRGVAKQATFRCTEDRVEFGRLLALGHERFGVTTHSYCLMDNHFHLVLHCPDGHLSESMQQLGSVFTRHANERSGRDGPLFRGRFRSIRITDEHQLLNTVRYVHRNALDIPGVCAVDRYRWSSHRTYLGHRRAPTWMDTGPVLDMFGQDRQAFDDFVSNDRSALWPVGPDALPEIVELVVAERHADVGPGVRRTLLLLVLERLSDGDRCRVIRMLGFEDEVPLQRALRRAARRAAAEPWLADAVEHVTRLAGGRQSCV